VKTSRPTVVAIAVVSLAVALPFATTVSSQTTEPRSRFDGKTRSERFSVRGALDSESSTGSRPTEAPTGFDNLTNGYLKQGPDFETINEDTVQPPPDGQGTGSFNDNRFIFEERETIDDGLGPTFNAQGCVECHQNVVTGGASQITEHRTGRMRNGEFFESLGGSLIHSRATYPDIVEKVAYADEIRTFRMSTNTVGNGFVESIANSTLLAIRDKQPTALRGTAVMVPVLEADGQARIGRFGWKSQHASLVSFSADAYLNEMGITSPLLPDENTASGRFVGSGSGYDPVDEPEDDGVTLSRSPTSCVPQRRQPRGPIDSAVKTGESLFNQIGCGICHTSIVTAAPGTRINGGQFTVPPALGNKVIHPYSDFLLHNIGTGDGVPVLPTLPSTANQIRTAPLWGLRTRNRLMHDGLSFTAQEAIQRHAGQATGVTNSYKALSPTQQAQLLKFLNSL
jgi:CxxC motif-containing protein (DUF1111 family)